MLGQPRVVGRALDREVERDLDPVLAAAAREVLEIVDRAELGVDRVVAAGLVADRPGGAGIAGAAMSALLRPLRLVWPIGWIGGR